MRQRDLPSRTYPTGPDDLAAPATAGAEPGRAVAARVDDILSAFLDRQADELQVVSAEAVPLVDCVRSLLAGGKRLRPAFCYWGWRGGVGSAGEGTLGALDPGSGSGAEGLEVGVLQVAAALELFQAAALIHDDVMDDSDTRRGQPAVHRRFAAMHGERAWHGDASRFGLAGAVLAGDLCLAWSDEMYSGAALPPSRLRAGRIVFDRMRTQLMGGQYLDMLEQSRPAAPGEAARRARQVIRFKSAKYSVEHPLLLGATLAGAATDLLEHYSAFGLLLGEAFQLRDDVLGVFGDPATTGKPAGDDLREGKRTLLVAYALQGADPAGASALEGLLGDPGLDDAGVARGRDVIRSSGALDRVEALIAEDVGACRKVLADADLPLPAADALDRLVAAATDRVA